MNSAAEILLDSLHRQGVVIEAKGGRLALDAPTGVLTAEVLAQLRAQKADLLHVLQGGGGAPHAPMEKAARAGQPALAAQGAGQTQGARRAPHIYPPGRGGRIKRVPAEVLEQVEAIWPKAQVFNWPYEAIFTNRCRFSYPYGGGWGLVAHLADAPGRIGEVTVEHIEVWVPGARKPLRHYRKR